jgi:hypothetical protein
MDNVQNCDSYINILSHKPIDSINLLGSWRRRNVFSVRYGNLIELSLVLNKRQDEIVRDWARYQDILLTD